MRFASTVSPALHVGFGEAVLSGFPADGGLYAPSEDADLRSLALALDESTPWADVASLTASALFAGDLDPGAAERAARAISGFPPRVADLDDDVTLVDLARGPSLGFKDYGMGFLASLAGSLLERRGGTGLVLVATTGDTGAAAAEAFADAGTVDVALLYPRGPVRGVLPERRLSGGGRVAAIQVDAELPVCRALVRSAYADRDAASRLGLLPATSANVGRLVPQVIYYTSAFAALKRRAPGDFVVAVPGGNLGNLISGLYAWRWGLPVTGFALADHARGERARGLVDYLVGAQGDGAERRFDEDDPENRERVKALAAGAPEVLRSMIYAAPVAAPEVAAAAGAVRGRSGEFLDPGAAAAYAAVRSMIDAEGLQGSVRVALLGLQHPGRSAAWVERAAGSAPDIPDRLRLLLEPFEPDARVAADAGALRATLERLFPRG